MTLSRTFGPLTHQNALKGAAVLFNDLGIYRLGIALAALDIVDIYDFVEFDNLVKYTYAAIMLGFMVVYFLRWKKIDATIAPLVFLLFFVLTGTTFALRYFIYEDRNSYISAFISPLIFCLAVFIPPNLMVLDAKKIVRDLKVLFSAGALFYLAEGIVKHLVYLPGFTNEIQLLKSISCLLALCLSILVGRKRFILLFALVAGIALELRPTSTFVLGLVCCVPIAIVLRFRVSGFRPLAVFSGRVMAMTVLLLVVAIPLLLYFFFDDVASAITDFESYLKSDVIGGQSNMAFRLAILKFAFTEIGNTSFWYGSALSGSITVPLGQNQNWQWWFYQDQAGEATIHSDFVIVLSLMGILGYIVFSGAFYFVLRARFRELARPSLRGSGVVLQAISIIACVALLIYSSDQPYLRYYSHTLVVWMLLLISEVARKSKVVG